MEPEGVKLKLKITSSNQELEVIVRKNMTLDELKEECCRIIGEVAEMKLIYRGKILKESDSLEILQPGQSLYLVKEKKSTVEPPAPVSISSGAGNMTGLLSGLNHFGVMNQATSMLNDLDSMQSENELESSIDPSQMAMISQMMSNPATRDMMLNSMQQLMSNPQMREMMVNSNPTLKRLAQSNPGVLDAMSSPMVVEQMKSMMQRMSLGNTAGTMSGDTSSFPLPGGGPNVPPVNPSNPIGNTGQVPPNPMNPFAQMMGFPSGNNPPNPFAQMMGVPPQVPPTSNPLLNPSSNPPMNPMANPFAMFNPMMMGNNPGNPYQNNPFMQMFNQGPPSAPIVPSGQAQNLRELYAAQLVSMKEMGFINEEANIKALQAASGDVNVAIERLLNMLG